MYKVTQNGLKRILNRSFKKLNFGNFLPPPPKLKKFNFFCLFFIEGFPYRHDIHSKVGLQPSRPSASTQAVSSSSSSGLGGPGRGQTGGQGKLGQEQEVTLDI